MMFLCDTARRGFVEQQHSFESKLIFDPALMQQMLKVLLCRLGSHLIWPHFMFVHMSPLTGPSYLT